MTKPHVALFIFWLVTPFSRQVALNGEVKQIELDKRATFDQSPPGELVFHFEAIDHLVQRIVADEVAWRQYFDACKVQPFTVVYEDLTAAYEATALNILRYLHIPIPENLMFAERRMKRQADALSEEWAQRYYNLKGE